MRKSFRTKQRRDVYADGSTPVGPARNSRSAFKEPLRHTQIHLDVANRAETASAISMRTDDFVEGKESFYIDGGSI